MSYEVLFNFAPGTVIVVGEEGVMRMTADGETVRHTMTGCIIIEPGNPLADYVAEQAKPKPYFRNMLNDIKAKRPPE